MDRNLAGTAYSGPLGVALRKESVDRNLGKIGPALVRKKVALRKESVDRNVLHLSNQIEADRSLSARRAWIEIFETLAGTLRSSSLSARRAWIEIAVIPFASLIIMGRSPQGERG